MLNKSETIKLLLENSSNGVMITLGDSSRMLDAKTIRSVVDHFKQWLDWYAHWIHKAKYYKEYSTEKIELDLDRQEKDWDKDDKEYSIGNDFASYLELYNKNGFCDNGKASDIIEKDWKKEFPHWKDELIFDAESSFCYVYTKNRDAAIEFSWWSYNKYIKHHLVGFEV